MDYPSCIGCFNVAFAGVRGCADCEHKSECAAEYARMEEARRRLRVHAELQRTHIKLNHQPYMAWMRRNKRK